MLGIICTESEPLRAVFAFCVAAAAGYVPISNDTNLRRNYTPVILAAL